MVLMWQAKVFAAMDAAAYAVETNWKHKVIPDRGDLMIACGISMLQWVNVNIIIHFSSEKLGMKRVENLAITSHSIVWDVSNSSMLYTDASCAIKI